MNYMPFVAWWFYGGTTAPEIAHFDVSWGLMEDLPAPLPVTVYPATWMNLCLTMLP